MRRICYVVGAMPLEPDLVFAPEPQDLVIAADGGYAALQERNITPGLIVGDFDSLHAVPNGGPVIRLPSIKDETDMGFALNQGLERGFQHFVLLGGMGGRLEHTIANLQLLAGLSRNGAVGILAGNGQAATVITNRSFSFPDSMSGFCSVFCQSGRARGVTLEGLKYPLDNMELTGCFPLGVSNEFLGVPAKVQVDDGSLLLIWETHGDLPEQLETLLQ